MKNKQFFDPGTHYAIDELHPAANTDRIQRKFLDIPYASSGAFILHTYIEDIIAKNPNIKEDRFFDELIKRYYGAYDEAYKNRMLDKMRDIASKQWIRKTVKSILDSRK